MSQLPSKVPTESVTSTFAATASSPPAAEKSTSVLSIRLTGAERHKLERQAAGQALSTFAREQLLAGTAAPRRSHGRAPIKDHEALGRVLGALGRSPAVGTLKGVLRACDNGALVMGAEAEDALRRACRTIDAMRIDLVHALGLKPE